MFSGGESYTDLRACDGGLGPNGRGKEHCIRWERRNTTFCRFWQAKTTRRIKMTIQEDNRLMRLIAERAAVMYLRYQIKIQSAYIENEIRIVHWDIHRLRLADLLNADDINFAHDIMGIHAHLDILDGRLKDFTPRFAL